MAVREELGHIYFLSLFNWWYDVVFKNQARGETKILKQFINDTIKSDFHCIGALMFPLLMLIKWITSQLRKKWNDSNLKSSQETSMWCAQMIRRPTSPASLSAGAHSNASRPATPVAASSTPALVQCRRSRGIRPCGFHVSFLPGWR